MVVPKCPRSKLLLEVTTLNFTLEHESVVFSPLSQGTIDIIMAIGNGGRRLGEGLARGRNPGEVGWNQNVWIFG